MFWLVVRELLRCSGRLLGSLFWVVVREMLRCSGWLLGSC